MKRFFPYLVGGAVLLALAAWVLLEQRSPAPAAPKDATPAAVGAQAAIEPVAVHATRHRLNPRPVPANARGAPTETPPTDPAALPLWPGSELTADEYAMSKLEIFRALQSQTHDWTIENYAQNAARRELLSGREAYQVYTYLRSCMARPRTVEELETATERVRSSERLARRMGTDGVEMEARRVRSAFVRCENLPPDSALPLIMIDWLTLAAERGFPQAQLAYYQSARWLLQLDEWSPYRYPERVHEYRRLAPLFIEAAFQAGHPDAFAEYALAMIDGIIFDRDAQGAYAYAVAADLAHDGDHADARNMMQLLEVELSPEAVRDARRAGRELCNRYCRTSNAQSAG